MIPQDIAIRAHQALFKLMRPHEAEAIAFDAGLRTGDYLLRHRIPKPAQWLLQRLPARLAADLLLAAIRKNAWTFAGSGQFAARRIKAHVTIDLFENPLAANPCAWHRGVFHRLFSKLVAERVTVVETQCCAAGAASCRFVITLPGAQKQP
jgi:divinyl protochlorophyllide a 8-vinyl-reductase